MKTHGFIIGMSMAFPLLATAQTPAKTPAPAQLRPTTTGKIAEAVAANRPRATSAAIRATTSMRAGGDGTRGGGETVQVRGIPELRDLVEKSVCEWVKGETVIETASYLPRILQNIARFDWYLARAIEEEIYRLDYCLTGPLVRVRTEDAESLTAVVTEGTSQVAIRLADAVYIDTFISSQMSARSFGYLLVHEALHSFLNMNESERNHKLRSMVKSIEGIENGRITNRQAFQLQLRRNSINFPAATVALDEARPSLEFAISGYDRRVELLRTIRLEDILSTLANLETATLWRPHIEHVQGVSLTSVVQEILFHDDAATLDLITRNSPSLARNITGLAYVHIDATQNPQVEQWLASQVSMVELAEDTLALLAKRQVRLEEGRILVSNQHLLANAGQATTPVSSLAALVSSSTANASAEAQIYFSLLGKSLESGDLAAARALSVGNPLFYQAFGIKQVLADITALGGASAQDRELALRNVRIMAIASWAYAENAVFSPVARGAWRKLKTELDATQLGYNL